MRLEFSNFNPNQNYIVQKMQYCKENHTIVWRIILNRFDCRLLLIFALLTPTLLWIKMLKDSFNVKFCHRTILILQELIFVDYNICCIKQKNKLGLST